MPNTVDIMYGDDCVGQLSGFSGCGDEVFPLELRPLKALPDTVFYDLVAAVLEGEQGQPDSVVQYATVLGSASAAPLPDTIPLYRQHAPKPEVTFSKVHAGPNRAERRAFDKDVRQDVARAKANLRARGARITTDRLYEEALTLRGFPPKKDAD